MSVGLNVGWFKRRTTELDTDEFKLVCRWSCAEVQIQSVDFGFGTEKAALTGPNPTSTEPHLLFKH